MPLKIIIFDGSSHPPVFIKRLIQALAAKGHKVYLLHFGSFRRSAVKNLQYISLGSSSNNYQLILRSMSISSAFNASTFFSTLNKIGGGNKKELKKWNLKLVLDNIQPDIIHVQWPSLLELMEDVLTEQKYQVILSQRGYQINVKPFVDTIYLEKLAHYFPKVSAFHSVSKAISKRGDLIWNSDAKLDTVIYTGLNLHNFSFLNNYSRSGKLKLSLVGRPHWKKGLHDLILACAILKRKDIDFELSIIGGMGNEEILFLMDRYNLQDNITIKEKLPQNKVYELMMASHLFVVSSIEEGIPNVLVEAMALGIPVISTDCGGVSELVEHTKQGWLVPTRNPRALAHQIEAFKQLPNAEVEEVRKNARQKVEEQHSYGKMLKGMEDLYQETIARSEI